MRYLILLFLLLTGCATRLVVTWETEEAVYGKSTINKDLENEKINTFPSAAHF